MQHDYSDKIDRRVRLVETDEEITDPEREQLLKFHEEIEKHNRRASANNQISGTRHESYLAHAHRLVRNTGLMLQILDPQTGVDVVDSIGSWIDEYDNGYTRDNYISALRAWGRFLAPDARDDKHPERFGVLELGNVEDDQPAPEPSEVLFWDDVITIIEAAKDFPTGKRTAAIVALLWATGARPMSEFWELEYRQIDDRGDHLLISIESDSKTFSRTIRIDVGIPYVRRWMYKCHPANDTERGPRPDTKLWTPMNEDRLLDYQQIRKSIKRVGKTTDLMKPLKPEHYRKSRASILASSRWVTQRDLEQHFGWARGSRVVAHYIAVFSDKSRKHIAKADGADVELDAEQEPIVPVWCDNCGRQTPRHRELCLWCPAETIASLGREPRLNTSPIPDEEKDLLDLIVSGEVDADGLRQLQKLEPVIRRRDDLFDRLSDYIEHAEVIAE
ncbi:Phage integrase family protein [Halopenitus malekzadehii]|uniref:Phage integrase family protein n=1 Tax=Halopenitus malekzadehii TaxID=1267564 RepID=A0A1H6JMF4_9EURY|nr:tyrosine-type recombinase/integrase [Halopenitus malekzadehii]SEH60951.1 Phage integrase family protein [Halopenitus malekzadehii]